MFILPLIGVVLAPLVIALGEQRVIYFPDDSIKVETGSAQAVFANSQKHHDQGFTIASKSDHYATPFLLDSSDNVAVHLAARTLARDIHTITGIEPRLYNDTLPSNISHAVIMGSVGSDLIKGIESGKKEREEIEGKWESYDVRVSKNPVKHLDSGLVIAGSDRVSFPLFSMHLNAQAVFDIALTFSVEQYTQSTVYPNKWAFHHSIIGLTSPSAHTPTSPSMLP
jgi:hypothetical protein